MTKQKVSSAKQKTPVAEVISSGKRPSFLDKHLYVLIIAVVSFLVYSNSIFNDYNLDDELVTQNHRLTSRGISAIPDIFTEPYYKDDNGYSYEYRPIVLTSFAIEHDLFGEHPHISHFFNVIFYSLLCILLFQSLKTLFNGQNNTLACIATLLFAIHPIHTEVVCSIKNRDEIFALTGGLLTLLSALLYLKSQKWIHLVAVIFFFTLSLLSKLTILSFALIIPLALILFRNISIKQLMLVMGLMSIPLFFLLNFPLVKDRLLIILACWLFSAILLVLKHSPRSMKDWRLRLTHFLAPYKENFSTYRLHFEKQHLLQLQSVVAGIPGLLLLGLTYFAFFTGNQPLFILLLLLVPILILVLQWEWKLILGMAYISLVVYFIYALHFHPEIIISVILFPIALLGIRSFGIQRITLLFFAILLSGISIWLSYNLFIVAIILFLVLFQPKGKLTQYKSRILFAALAIEAISLILELVFKSNLNLYFDLFYLFLVASYFSDYKNSFRGLNLALIGLVIPLLFFLQTQKYPLKTNSIHTNTSALVLKAPSFIEASNRPQNFVETPVTGQSPMDIKVGTSLDITAKYIKLLLLPYPLSYYYGYKYIDALSFWNAYPILVFSFLLILSILGLYFINKDPILSFSLYTCLISIFSVLPLFTTLSGMMADRYLLIPSFGFCLLVSQVLLKLFKTSADNTKIATLPVSLKIIFACVFILFATLTIARNKDWKDRITLFTKDIQAVHNSAQAHNLLGVHLALKARAANNASEQKDLQQKACTEFRKALTIYPDFMNAAFDLGRTQMAMGNYKEAIAAFKTTIRINPEFSEAYDDIAVLLDNEEKYAEAIPYYEKSISFFPDKWTVYANLSFDYFRINEIEKSLNVCRKATERFPDNYQPYYNMGKVFNYTGQRDSTLIYFEKAYKYNNRDLSLVNALYSMYASTNDPRANYFAEQLNALSNPK